MNKYKKYLVQYLILLSIIGVGSNSYGQQYFIGSKASTMIGVDCDAIGCITINNSSGTVYLPNERTMAPLRSSKQFRTSGVLRCEDVMVYSVNDPGRNTYLIAMGKFTNRGFLNLGLTGNTGKFSVTLHYQLNKRSVRRGCQQSTYEQEGRIDFCRLKKNNTMYGLVGPTDGNAGESVSAIADASGEAVIRLTWVGNEANYCHETLSRAAGGRVLVVRMADSDPGTSIVKEDGTPISWEAGTGESSKRYYPPVKLKGIGRHVVSMRVKDRFGNEFYTPPITVTVLPSCYAAPDPVVTLSGPGIQTIGGGYNDPLGSYRLQQDKEYTLSLGNFIEDFCSHYQVSLGDGYTVVPPSMDGPCLPPVHSGAPLSSGLEITGHLPDNRGFRFIPRDQISGYKIDVQKRPSLSAAESNPVLGYMCPDYKPIVITVGGENENYSSNCLIVLAPSTVPVLFPAVSSYTTINSILQYFDYSLYSSQGIIVRSEGGDGVFLRDGALLQIISSTGEEELPLVEQADNDKNWVQARAYDDDGRVIAETKQFFDNRARSVQVQTKNLTAGVVMATQTLYDKYGRAAIETLPAPVRAREKTEMMDDCGDDIQRGSDLYFAYKHDFIASNGLPYSYMNFDNTDGRYKKENPDRVDATMPGSLGWYYGSLNTRDADVDIEKNEHLFIEPFVAATSYPYQRNLYLEDGTNEVHSITLPGDVHKAGTGRQASKLTSFLNQEDKTLIDHYMLIRRIHVFPGTTGPVDLDNAAFRSLQKNIEHDETITIYDEEGHVLIKHHLVSGDLRFTYFDIFGRLVCEITPNGMRDLLVNSTNKELYKNIDKVTYRYNLKGEIVEISEKDFGMTRFMYRKDGKLRYSQNEKQRQTNSFFYFQYDYAQRIIETGVFTPTPEFGLLFGSEALGRTLEEGVLNEGLTEGGVKSEIIGSIYDIPDLAAVQNGYITGQSFTRKKLSCHFRAETVTDTIAKTWYSYDERGRIVWTAKQLPGLTSDMEGSGIKKIQYTYASDGNVKEVAYTGIMSNDYFYHVLYYDLDGRLSKVYTTLEKPVYDHNGQLANGKLQAKYEYSLHGPLKRVELAENLQGIDYAYTPQGWLKAINYPNTTYDPGRDGSANSKFPEDVFAMRFDYHDNDYVKPGIGITSEKYSKEASIYKQHYNGLISGTVWMTKDEAGIKKPGAYAYEYDAKYQLKNADFLSADITSGSFLTPSFTTGHYQEKDINYDANGNIVTLVRTGSDATTIHDFRYHYAPNSNRLEQVQNLVGASTYASYTYDAIGQIRSMTQNGKTTYTHFDNRGMLTAMTKDENGDNPIVKFYYDDMGLRYKKEAFDSDSFNLLTTSYYTYDIGKKAMAVYDNNNETGELRKVEAPIYGTERLGMLSFRAQIQQYQYELKDHLGNIRSVIYPIYETPAPLHFITSFEGTDLDAYGADYTNLAKVTPEEIIQPGYGSQSIGLRFPSRNKTVSYRVPVKPGDRLVSASIRAYFNNDGVRAGRLVAGLFNASHEQLYYDIDRMYPAIDSSSQAGVKFVWNTLTLPSLKVPTILYDVRGNIVDNDDLFMELFVRQGAESGDAEILYDQMAVNIQYSSLVARESLQGLVAYTNYYPYGLPMDNKYLSGSEYRLGYQGKYSEYDPETGLNSFELRMYDPAIGRWLSVDPEREFHSPYVGMGNVPTMFTDPSGGAIQPFVDGDIRITPQGVVFRYTVDDKLDINDWVAQDPEVIITSNYKKPAPYFWLKWFRRSPYGLWEENHDGMNVGAGGPHAIGVNVNAGNGIVGGSAGLTFIPTEGVLFSATGHFDIKELKDYRKLKPDVGISLTQYFVENPYEGNMMNMLYGMETQISGQAGNFSLGYGVSNDSNGNQLYRSLETGINFVGGVGVGAKASHTLMQVPIFQWGK